jgi:COP9 signalosome complex subunit 3
MSGSLIAMLFQLLPTPKYTHPLLVRIFKAGPYAALAKVYPGTSTQGVTGVAEKEQKTWAQDENTGLVRQVIDRAPRWQVRKLTDTYVTLSLPEIGKAVSIESEAEIRALVVGMVSDTDRCSTPSSSVISVHRSRRERFMLR